MEIIKIILNGHEIITLYQVLTILYLYICINKKNINYKYDNIYFKNIN